MTNKTNPQFSKILEKLNSKVENGEYYEAQQLYTTLSLRMQKRGKTNEAIQLLSRGIHTMATHEQYESASFLGVSMINIFTELKIAANEQTIMVIEKFAQEFPKSASKSLITFLKTALSWNKAVSQNQQADPKIEYLMAKTYYNLEDFSKSKIHFLRSNGHTEEFAKMVYDWIKKGQSWERDFFIVRTVLELLNAKKERDAGSLFQKLVGLYFKDQENTHTPLLNFLSFLLITIKKKSTILFETLFENYKDALSRDPELLILVKKVGAIYCGVKLESNNSFDIFNGVVSSLFKNN
ncbi:golgi to er traffic protein [Anaeramoeba flamelloides]|uniref:Golgi to er traffic protein n=1 Tax=Anaeramoeba flamelloides TaxID=1746091 RepID=A0AAV7YAP9_9EUKA|nr:golgi to er traffic protein 4 [Anaeramoeba flamelloides]KAJ6252778.1 golgi to er traffic protein [Anaeramoeba flamelloides]